MTPVSVNSTGVLYVEGEGDYFFTKELSEKHDAHHGWSINRKNGFSSVMKAAKTAITKRGGSTVGIMVDADIDINARWENISRHFGSPEVTLHRQVNLPKFPIHGGTIIDGENGMPRVGIWVMPDNASSGELEDFLVRMIRPADPIWPKSKKYIDGIPQHKRRFGDKVDRAQLYAWLATCQKPPYIGYAIQNCEFNWNAPNCPPFIDWLNRLFIAPS